jgi:hypothetical protein
MAEFAGGLPQCDGGRSVKPTFPLRLAAVISLLLCVGHTLGRPWTPAGDAAGAAVVEAMKTYHMQLMGVERSYFDFYLGFGWIISVYLLAQAALLWCVASLGATDAARVRPFVAVFFIASLMITVLDWQFLFAIPLVMSAVITLCLGWALLAVRSTHAVTSTTAAGGRR